MRGLLRLCRLYYGVPMALTYLLTVYYAAGGELAGQWAGALLSTLGLLLVIAGGYVLNDVCDAEVDRVNAPGRPIPSGRVRRKSAGVLAAALLAGGLGVAAACRWQYLAALAAVAGGLVAYDVLSKRIGPAKQVVVAVLMTSIYPLALAQAGGATGPRAWTLAVFPAWLLPTSFGYELLKDLRDAVGDRQAALRPTRVQRRPLLWRRIAAGVILAAAPLLLLPGWLGCKWLYLIGATCAIVLAVASAMAPIRRAIRMVYLECLLTAVAAAADVAVLGM